MFNISKIELENFRSFSGPHTFEFPTEPGLYAITGKNLENPRLGPNGVGKSTLLEAVFWAFYGRTSRGLKAGDVVSWGAKSCSVDVHVLIGNTDLTITRTQSPNSLRLNNQPVDQETLQKALHIGPEAFTYAVMIPQFGDAFFDLAPGDKLTLFSQIMELDYWLDKSKEAADLANEILKTRTEYENKIARNKGQLETIDGDIENLRAKNKTFSDAEAQRIKRLKQEVTEAQANVTEADEAMTFTNKALKNLAVKLEQAERGAKKCPTCGQPVANKELNALLTNQSDFERQLRKLERDKDAAQGEIRTIKTAMAPRENPYADQITEKLQAKNLATKAIVGLKTEIDTLNEDHTAISYWVTGFKRVRLFIVEETLRQLELEINNSLASLGLLDWHIELDVERENKSGGITKGFTVLVHAPGAPGPVKFESYSGGETQRLRLAGDLGMANLIMERAGLSNTIECFDEPSRHLSQEGMLDLAETLHQRAIDQKKRCIIIEHNLLDYPYTGAITIVKDANGSRIEPN
jgi:DNA repair exonuclease SbcCD ATPase subunit